MHKTVLSTIAALTVGAIAATGLALRPGVAVAGEGHSHAAGEKSCSGDKACSGEQGCSGEKKDAEAKKKCGMNTADESGDSGCGGKSCSGAT